MGPGSHAIRDDVNKSLETARAAKVIGKSLEAEVELHCDGELYDFASSVQEMLPDVFIVSKVAPGEGYRRQGYRRGGRAQCHGEGGRRRQE